MAEEGKTGCITVRDIAAPKFISAFAEVLKNNDKFVVPKWADIVKTGPFIRRLEEIKSHKIF